MDFTKKLPFTQNIGSIIKFSDLVKFTHLWWNKEGKKIIRMIQRDSRKGILQEPEKAYYTSRQYMARKARRFNRATGGGKLKGYYASHMSSNRTDSVDMRLTGETMGGMHVQGSTLRSVNIDYPTSSADKIKYNEQMCRSIRELRKKNIDKVSRDIAREVQRKISEEAKKETLIILGI